MGNPNPLLTTLPLIDELTNHAFKSSNLIMLDDNFIANLWVLPQASKSFSV